MEAAKNALRRNEQVLIINGDLASFYDTVEPSFMLDQRLVSRLQEHGMDQAAVDDYMRATASLLRAYGRYRKEALVARQYPLRLGYQSER